MPANVVKTPEDEKHWDEAKERAKEEGRDEDWPYVMGIFKKMTGRTAGRTAFAVPYAFSPVAVSGRRLAFQGMDVVLAEGVPSSPRGCYRGLLRVGTQSVATYVGPNALSPLAVLVRQGSEQRPALLVGFDSGEEAISAYGDSGPRGPYSYRAASVAEVAAWARRAAARV